MNVYFSLEKKKREKKTLSTCAAAATLRARARSSLSTMQYIIRRVRTVWSGGVVVDVVYLYVALASYSNIYMCSFIYSIL